MSNFKGTKGKWRVYPSKGFSNEFYICDVDCVFGEQEANALLISKAPEMLEFIINVFNTMPNGSVIQEKAKQLIKEATEL